METKMDTAVLKSKVEEFLNSPELQAQFTELRNMFQEMNEAQKADFMEALKRAAYASIPRTAGQMVVSGSALALAAAGTISLMSLGVSGAVAALPAVAIIASTTAANVLANDPVAAYALGEKIGQTFSKVRPSNLLKVMKKVFTKETSNEMSSK